MKKFIPCLSEPAATDPYFIRRGYGGLSPCIAGSPNIYNGKSALANCVGWAWGRVAQILEDPHCKIGCAPGNDWPGSAQHWVEYSREQGYEVGSTPKLGAVMVWKHKTKATGHVAVVEQITGTRVITSESNYNGVAWCLKNRPASGYLNSHYDFLGYIYLPIDFDIDTEPTDELKRGDRVEIIGPGNGQANGKGKSAGGRGYIRYIYQIYKGQPYPYRVGWMNGMTTGFYPASSLKKV